MDVQDFGFGVFRMLAWDSQDFGLGMSRSFCLVYQVFFDRQKSTVGINPHRLTEAHVIPLMWVEFASVGAFHPWLVSGSNKCGQCIHVRPVPVSIHLTVDPCMQSGFETRG